MGSTLDWRAHLTVDDEVCVYCPDWADAARSPNQTLGG